MKNGLFERNGSLDARNHVFTERAAHLVHGLAAVFAGRDEFGNKRVVIRWNGVAGVGMTVQPYTAAAGLVIHLDPARAGAKVIERVLGVDAAFDGVPLEREVVLREFQRLTHRNQNLLFDQVHTCDLFGNCVFDLNALVNFEEVEISAAVHEEFDGPGVGVMGRFGDAHGCLAHFFAQILELVFD